MTNNNAKINKLFDHTLLKPDAKRTQIKNLAEEAMKYDFMSVCLNPYWVSYAADLLKNSSVKVCTVIGFPLGANSTKIKALETSQAIEDGATEIDMVINIGLLRNEEYDLVYEDILAVVEAAKNKALVKVIIETCLLNDQEIVKVCELSVKAGADFVKTSTGFSVGGATIEDVALMSKTVGPDIGVKASGGISTIGAVNKLVEAGATRIGASSGITIIESNK